MKCIRDDPLPEDIIEEDDYDKSWIFDAPQSEEIIQQLGFDKATAAYLWQYWTEWAEEGGSEFSCASRDVPFLDLVKGRADDYKDVWGDNDAAWIEWMQERGIATELQEAIMDPRFKQLRMTRTCSQWVLDTIDMRYNTFYDKHAQRESDGTEHDPSGNTVETDTNLATKTLGVTVLYKAIVRDRHRKSSFDLLDSEGRLNHLSYLKTYSESEFSQSKAMIHLDTSLQTAQLRASYLRRRSNDLGQEIVIVKLCIPDRIKEDISLQVYFPSDDWKKLVWYCRTWDDDQKLRADVSRLYRAALKIGNVASRPEKAFEDLNSWEEITEEHVLKLDGHNEQEVQYVLDGDDDGETLLRQHVTDVKIIPYSTEEYLEWMEAHKDRLA